MKKNAKIYIAGHEGMVGSTLLNELSSRGYSNILTKPFSNLDLRNQKATFDFISSIRPEYVFLIAGKVGGIQANIEYSGEFLYDNVMISANVIEAARLNRVEKLLFLGSSCIYPKHCKQPMKEESLLTGALEPTNEGYAIGKITGLKLCEYYREQYGCDFIAAMPPNLYGPGDSFSLKKSHVISALIQKVHKAKVLNQNEVTVWGTGTARREFLFVEDVVDGLIFLMENYNDSMLINIGSGVDISIQQLAQMIKKIIGYQGDFKWDTNKPDGMPQKLMDSTKINDLGWMNKYSLKEGLSKTYSWYKAKIMGEL